MAKAKESKAAYSAEPITTVTARGTTEIPRVLRQRYRVTSKSRLRWTDTGKGLLVVPLDRSVAPKNGKRRKIRSAEIRPENLEAIKILRDWMEEPDDWTPGQWDEFERELKTNKLRFGEIDL